MKIGSIYACIAGDHRYGTRLEVVRDDATGEVRVEHVSTNPVGGMDGPGGTFQDRKVLHRWAKDTVTAPALVTLLRTAFAKVDGGTVARYGKPSKRFAWQTEDGEQLGFSAALAKRALQAVEAASVG